MFTIVFWKAVAERALKTAGQAAALAIGSEFIDGTPMVNALAVDWVQVGGFALGGVVISVLTSVASHAVTGVGPSLTGEVLDNYAPQHAVTE